MTLPTRARASFASLPDRGDLLAYDRDRPVRQGGAYTWHPVELSEAHAMRAIAAGELVVTAPNGQPIKLRYQRHIEHDNGNWTWIGRVPGTQPGSEAIITFGEKAAFGSIPYEDHAPLRLTIAGGSAWLIETDNAKLARMNNTGTRPSSPDHRVPPLAQRPMTTSGLTSVAQMAEAAGTAVVGAEATTTVDVLLGYTNGFATRLGGQSQAVTRLTFLVDVTNQAYVNSQISAQIRLVRTQQVTYPDATNNETALYELTGCIELSGGGLDCDFSRVPASLQPLLTAQDQYGADLVSLVRVFNDPENDGCGIAWLLGAEQTPIEQFGPDSGLSVVSDSSGSLFPDNGYICRDETLAHELGHNMGSTHDRETAEGDDGVLDPEDYGRYPYSFGHKTGAGQGNFYTVMAYGDSGQNKYRVFSNPAITYCGGYPCGVANTVDNARSLRQTIPVIATFRNMVATQTLEPVRASGDFDGDGKFDLLWRNSSTGANLIWKAASTSQNLTTVASQDWKVVGTGDFNGDHQSDIVWRNSADGRNSIWRSGNSNTSQYLTALPNLAWKVAGVGDFDGDGKADILWRNYTTGANSLWKSGTTSQYLTTVADLNWKVLGVGDFNNDGKDDILWRNTGTGANEYWKSANSATKQALATLTNMDWQVAGTGDFDGDNKADILWRNLATGANLLWKAGTTGQSLTTLTPLTWKVAGLGDYNGDGKTDIMWRNATTGANQIWNSGNSATPRALSTVSNLSWKVVP
ncbi:MAG TPA: FG-GAP-like repeat-containing protein [Lysobacter sp.]